MNSKNIFITSKGIYQNYYKDNKLVKTVRFTLSNNSWIIYFYYYVNDKTLKFKIYESKRYYKIKSKFKIEDTKLRNLEYECPKDINIRGNKNGVYYISKNELELNIEYYKSIIKRIRINNYLIEFDYKDDYIYSIKGYHYKDKIYSIDIYESDDGLTFTKIRLIGNI